MKNFALLLITILFASSALPQTFEWANSYNISGANEVAGFSIDELGNTYSVGVFGAPVSLPYLGNATLMKTNVEGELEWSSILCGDVFFGDLTAVGDKVCVVGQAYSTVNYNGYPIFASETSFMFIILVNGDGTLAWSQQFTDRHAQFANIDYHDGTIALQARGEFNSGNHMMYFSVDGNLIQERVFDDFSIVDLSYFNGKTYINGSGGFSGFFIDDVFIDSPVIESSTFIFALDENLNAMWAHSGSAINNHDGRVEANEAGIFSYLSIVTPSFNFTSEIWHLDFDGTLINSINPPVFTNAVSLYPDMVVTDCHVALFAQNNFDFTSHEIIIMDHDLNVISEKSIDGNSYLYSGQISSFQNNIYVSHIHSGNLNFDDDLTLDISVTGSQSPYIARLSFNPQDCLVAIEENEIQNFSIYPNPTTNAVTIQSDMRYYDWKILSVDGKIILTGSSQNNLKNTLDVSSIQTKGTYFLSLSSGEQITYRKLMIN